MDAKRRLWWVWCAAVIVTSGCMEPYSQPANRPPRQSPPDERPYEPPQVVDTKPVAQGAQPQEAADVNDAVLGYIERVDGARQRASERKSERPPSGGGVRPASDETVTTTTRPVEPPAVRVIPEALSEPPASAPAPAPASQPGGQAPVLGHVTVRGVPPAEAPGPTEAPDGPAINAPAVARATPASLKEFLQQMVPPAEASFREQLDLRMLRVVAGDYEGARQPLTLVTAEQQELAARFIEAWITVRDAHMGDLPGAAQTAAQELAELQAALRRLSDLSVPVVKICSAVRGFGQYDLIEPPRFAAGSAAEFVLYCEVRDFVSERRDDEYYHTTFDLTTTILTRAGESVLEVKDADIVDRCRNRRQDCFVPRLVRLPLSLSPGQYVAKVTIVDKLGRKVAENRASFELVARP